MRKEPPSLAEGQIVIRVKGDAVAGVSLRVGVVAANADHGGCTVSRPAQRLARVVQSVRPCIGGKEGQAMAIALLQRRLYRVVTGDAREFVGIYAAEGREWLHRLRAESRIDQS